MYPNLKLAIFKRGIHQNLLSRDLGLNEAILSKIIRGNREPTGSQRQMLAQYLQADEGWLFERYERIQTIPGPPHVETKAAKDAEP
jgi:transcriptional regulator with XRE-family HTH domain